MSARQLRRAFAAPFVITLAGSAALAACGPKPLPKHTNPPGPHTNPPAPEAAGSGHDHDHDHSAGEAKTPSPTDPATPAPTAEPHHNPPPPEVVKLPAKYEQKWTVIKHEGKADCSAMVDVTCPKGEPGQPMPTCNPPPPIKYACPAGFKDGETMKIILRVGATDCFVDRGSTKCPAGVKCNPPPPRMVACPER
jgi:hypothetical protein